MFKQYKEKQPMFLFFLNVIVLARRVDMGEITSQLTPTSSVVHYWKHQIQNDISIPSFILSKASPLTMDKSEFFSRLLVLNNLSYNLQSFCISANLFCFPESISINLDDFITYTFTSYAINSLSSRKRVDSWVDPGKFFHEFALNPGTVIPMPNIQDRMPKRSFLPRVISSKLPFSMSQLTKLRHFFHLGDNSTMGSILSNTLQMCEREPSLGETKKCVGSIEDMIDFAVLVLGHNLTVRSMENILGSNMDVMIGSVTRINGGKVTKAISCHQTLYPYLVYYCHSVPKVRLYEAHVLDVKSKEMINKGVAICHLDTTSWSPTHGAFAALKSSPGDTQVCHWIYENDMIWTTAD